MAWLRYSSYSVQSVSRLKSALCIGSKTAIEMFLAWETREQNLEPNHCWWRMRNESQKEKSKELGNPTNASDQTPGKGSVTRDKFVICLTEITAYKTNNEMNTLAKNRQNTGLHNITFTDFLVQYNKKLLKQNPQQFCNCSLHFWFLLLCLFTEKA